MLVLQLVFDNKESFKNLDRKECKNILQVFHKELVQTNMNILNACILYNCEHFYYKLNHNIRRYLFAKKKYNKVKMELYMKKEKNIMNMIMLCSYADCLKMFLLSEYKEYIHENMFSPYHKQIDNDILNELERIVHNLYGFDDVYNYRHNPHHFLFKNKLYTYYDLIESKGINIMDSCEDEIASFSY